MNDKLLIDTDILIDYLRGNPQAVSCWLLIVHCSLFIAINHQPSTMSLNQDKTKGDNQDYKD